MTEDQSKNDACEKYSVFLSRKVYSELYVPEPQPHSIFQITDQVEISVVTDGAGIHRILNGVTECHAGDAYIFSGSVTHEYFAASENERPTVMTMRFNALKCFMGEVADIKCSRFCYGVFRDKAPISYAMLNSRALEQFKSIYREIEEEQSSRELAWEQAVNSRLTLLLIILGRYINMADTARTDRPREWLTVSAAAREIMERYGESELTLESVASSLYISKSHLSRIFQKVMGESFPDYVRNVRLSRACELLRDTELTNEEIVGRCGLRDVPAFYRLFKSAIGMTPYRYRSRQSGAEEGADKLLGQLSETLQRGNVKKITALTITAIERNLSADDILRRGLIPGMNAIGEKFKRNQVYVPEVLVAARCMNAALQTLRPFLTEVRSAPVGRVCIGTVQGDLHDIGKNLVKIMMESKGLEVIDLGTDVSSENFVKAAIEHNCQVICCSALLTSTMGVMADVVRAAKEQGIRENVKILIGGAPVSEEFCREIGADMYTPDAASAADAAIKFCFEQLAD